MVEIAKKHRHTPAQVSASMRSVHIYIYEHMRIHLLVIVLFSQVLLRYHVQQGIVVIPKSDKPHHILENTKVETPPSLSSL